MEENEAEYELRIRELTGEDEEIEESFQNMREKKVSVDL